MDHVFYVAAAYVATALVLAGLVVWLIVDGKARRREIAALERAGIARRSANRSGRE